MFAFKNKKSNPQILFIINCILFIYLLMNK